MATGATQFWQQVDAIRELAQADDRYGAQARLAEALQSTTEAGGDLNGKRGAFLSLLAKTYDLQVDADAARPKERRVGPIRPGGIPGVSLVTCCKNRNQNLLRALPSWLACDDLAEIIIVDWASDTPVREDLEASGLFDSRIRVVRFDDEPRWILSYAFNAGFRFASHNRVLKVDADVVIAPDFFERNVLGDGIFIAGNWRSAPAGQEFVNGFFYCWKSDLAAVGGFNEHITTYGWDDEELYLRLVDSGLRRQDVAPSCVDHIPHSDEARKNDIPSSGDKSSAVASARMELKASTQFLIRRNRFIANVMPHWSDRSVPLPLVILDENYAGARVRRQGWLPSAVPDTIWEDANHYGLRELASWHFGRRTLELNNDALSQLLEKPMESIVHADIEVALAGRADIAMTSKRYLILRLSEDQVEKPGEEVVRSVVNLTDWARRHDLTPIVMTSGKKPADGASPCFGGLPFIPAWGDVGAVQEMNPSDLTRDGVRCWTAEKTPIVVRLDQAAHRKAAVEISVPRKKLFIDAQHGMGNRLRAIASAACVAEKSDRELVVVWGRDAHCDCALTDLFDYKGAVIEEPFVKSAPHLGCEVYNYMGIEEGAQKDQPINVSLGHDIYARSAFVLASDLTSWNDENRFLKSLVPTAEVLALVNSVRNPNDVSAHIRMQAGKGLDNTAYDSAEGNWSQEDHDLIQFWRDKSHYSHFVRRLHALFDAGEAETLFVAADLPETYDIMAREFGDRLAYLPRSVNDRSAEQLRYGLADAILLGRSRRLLASNWSSFSELALRLAGEDIVVEMSGKDF